MGLIDTAKTVAGNLAAEVPTTPTGIPIPTPQNVPSINDVVTNSQTIAHTVVNTTSDLVNTVLNAKVAINPEVLALARQVGNDFSTNLRSILGNLDQSTKDHLQLSASLSFEPDKLLTALGSAMSAAEDALAKKKGHDLFISDGKIAADFYVKLPGPASGTGAFAHVELNLKSKQYLALTAGKG